MKIILAIVDELPKSANSCIFNYFCSHDFNNVLSHCELTFQSIKVSGYEYATQRCPNCPLVEEAENFHADEVQG